MRQKALFESQGLVQLSNVFRSIDKLEHHSQPSFIGQQLEQTGTRLCTFCCTGHIHFNGLIELKISLTEQIFMSTSY